MFKYHSQFELNFYTLQHALQSMGYPSFSNFTTLCELFSWCLLSNSQCKNSGHCSILYAIASQLLCPILRLVTWANLIVSCHLSFQWMWVTSTVAVRSYFGNHTVQPWVDLTWHPQRSVAGIWTYIIHTTSRKVGSDPCNNLYLLSVLWVNVSIEHS